MSRSMSRSSSRPVRLVLISVMAAIALVLPAHVATAAAPPQITTAALPTLIQGAKMPTTTLKVTGGTWPYKWSVVAGSLPYGLKLSSGGQLSGATNTPFSPQNITVQVKDARGLTATRDYSIVVNPWKIVTPSLKPVKKGQLYYAQLKINGGCIAYPTEGIYSQRLNWRILPTSTYPGNLPAGLKISKGGAISGSPKAVGTFTFLVYAECQLFNNGSDARPYTLVVS